MGDFDYSYKPQIPQFRESNGSLDWRQIADMFIPGNVWNSHTNQYRPLGIVQGLTRVPVDTMYGAARNSGSFLGSIGRGVGGLFGGRSPIGRSPTMPDFSGSFGRISNDMANYRGGRNFTDMDNNRIRREAGSVVSDINDFRNGGGESRAERGESPIGLGQLGRGGDEAVFYYSQAMRNRNGAEQER